ncbi:MAG: DMT family transporter [Paracoccaceae bacterium]|nr:DMT family transporter [Paracoccaceae bacterium]
MRIEPAARFDMLRHTPLHKAAKTMPPVKSNLPGVVMALAAFAVFASHDAAIKSLGGRYSVVQIVFYAQAVGLPIALAVLLAKGGVASLRPRHLGLVALRTVAVCLAAAGAFYAFGQLPLAQTYAILFSTPLIISALSVPILRERVGPRRALAIVVGMCGVLIALRPGAAPLELGHLAALISAFGAATAAVLTRRLRGRERVSVLLIYPMLTNLIMMGLFLPALHQPMPLPDIGLMVYVGVCALVAMGLMIRAYTMAEAALVAPMQYSQILWAAFYGAVFFAEWPTVYTLLGAALVIASGVYIVMRELTLRAPQSGQAPAP